MASENQYTGFFWNEHIWLPPNVTWSQLTDASGSGGVNYTNFYDLGYPILAAGVVIILRALFEKLVFRPLGIFVGIRPSVHKSPARIDALERHIKEMKKTGTRTLSDPALQSLAQTCGLTTRKVERYFRKRRLENRPSTIEKFAETGWRWLYYTGIFIFGLRVLWTKPWMWDIKHCWYNYPHHSIENDIWWYYMIEMSFYWSLCFSQFFMDAKRKDFWEMFIHHLTTISLMALSWTCNLTRVGSLVLIVHDVADVLLEPAKLFIYAEYKKTSDIVFGCFALTWIISRLGVYPTWILYSTTIEAPQLVEMFPAYYIFNFLLSILLVLHVIWTYYILKIAYRSVVIGTTEDSRSDSEDETISSTLETLDHDKEDAIEGYSKKEK